MTPTFRTPAILGLTDDEAQRVQRELARMLSGRGRSLSRTDRDALEAEAYAAAGVRAPVYLSIPIVFSKGSGK